MSITVRDVEDEAHYILELPRRAPLGAAPPIEEVPHDALVYTFLMLHQLLRCETCGEVGDLTIHECVPTKEAP